MFMLNEYFNFLPDKGFGKTIPEKVYIIRGTFKGRASVEKELPYDEFDPRDDDAELKMQQKVIY